MELDSIDYNNDSDSIINCSQMNSENKDNNGISLSVFSSYNSIIGVISYEISLNENNSTNNTSEFNYNSFEPNTYKSKILLYVICLYAYLLNNILSCI